MPGFASTPTTGLSYAGQWLNTILEELAQTYDFDEAKGVKVGNFNTSLLSTASYPNVTQGGGPYSLPSDYERCIFGDAMWFLQGVSYLLKPIDLAEYDQMVQQAGNQSYPYLMATDMSQSPPVFLVWPPPSGNFQYQIRYYRLPIDITTPEGSATVPWFRYQSYLIKRLTGELMGLSGDPRQAAFLGDEPEHPGGAAAMLRKFLRQANDSENRAKTVKMDPRRFSRNFDSLPNTKSVGF